MNCWEAVFFSAYRAGIVPESFLRDLHERAAAAGRAAERGAQQTSRTDEAGTPRAVGVEAYNRVLEAALGLPGATDITRACPSLARGDIVFFNGRAHVAIATGGGNQIQSLWTLPDNPPARRDGFQSTTVEAVADAMEQNLMGRPRVQVAPCPW
jgi:cell wall-associated NlpC family hydrolase